MKLKWGQIVSLIVWAYKVFMKIIKTDTSGVNDLEKHGAVKAMIMPYVNKKGWDFNGSDIDRIINGFVWFIKTLLRVKRKKKDNADNGDEVVPEGI